MVSFDEVININGVNFTDVTNQTVSGHVYSYGEAVAHTQGRILKVYISRKARKKKMGKGK